MKVTTTQQGFTLIELLVVIVVIAILATLAISNFGNIPAQGRDSDRRNDIQQLSTQLNLYAQDSGQYPATGDVTDAAAWQSTFEAPDITSPAPEFNTELITDPDDVVINGGGDYRYLPVDSSGAACATAGTLCTDYSLEADLETETDPFTIDGQAVQ